MKDSVIQILIWLALLGSVVGWNAFASGRCHDKGGFYVAGQCVKGERIPL